jgi:hypothetical protein
MGLPRPATPAAGRFPAAPGRDRADPRGPPLAGDHRRGRRRHGAGRGVGLGAARADLVDHRTGLAPGGHPGHLARRWFGGLRRPDRGLGHARRRDRPAPPRRGPQTCAYPAGRPVAGAATSGAAGRLPDQPRLQPPLRDVLPARDGAAALCRAGRPRRALAGHHRPGPDRRARPARPAGHPRPRQRRRAARRRPHPGRPRTPRRCRHLPRPRRLPRAQHPRDNSPTPAGSAS